MPSNEVTWFNQRLLDHQNYEYSPDSRLSVSVSTRTSDWQNFNDPTFVMSIFKETGRSYNVHLQVYDVVSIVKSFDTIKDNLEEAFSNGFEVTRKYYQKTLRIKFRISKKNERIIVLAIIFSNSDFAVSVITPEIFMTLHQLMISFVNEYMNIAMNLINRSLLTSIRSYLDNNNKLLRSLPSSVLSNERSEGNNIIDNQNDFDNFMQKNLDNIDVPGLEELLQSTDTTSIQSSTITKVFRNIQNLEQYVTTLYIVNNPFQEIIQYFSQKLDTDTTNFFPEISSKQLKSLSYISSFIFKYNVNKYHSKKLLSTTGIPILRYSCQNPTTKNLEMAYELLVIIVYLKLLSSKIENKESDNLHNKNLLYINFRNIIDPLIFSFINENSNFIDICINKYQILRNEKFFEEFDNLLIKYNCKIPSEYDIRNMIQEIISKNNLKSLDIIELHKKLEKNLEISSDDIDILDQEQINKFLASNKELSIIRYFKANDIENVTTESDVNKLIQSKEKVKSDIIRRAISVWNPKDIRMRYDYEYFKKMLQEKNVEKTSRETDWLDHISNNF